MSGSNLRLRLVTTLVALAFTLVASAVMPFAVQRSEAATPRVNRTLSSGIGHSCAIGADGTLNCWGANENGQIGDGTTTARDTLTVVGSATDWIAVSAGNRFTCAIRNVSSGGGSLWCWGRNTFGQLGLGTLVDEHSPVRVGTGANWISVSTGLEHACGITSSGSLYCWGRNHKGQIGNTSSPSGDVTTPTRIAAGTTWSRVEAGFGSTIAVDVDGKLWTWGFNDVGQLGDGTILDHFEPVQVGTDTDWEAPLPVRFNPWPVGSGSATSPFSLCARKQDESVWCAGYNYMGSFGTGGWASSLTTFTRSGGLLDTYSEASVSDGFGCGIRATVGSTGTLWCWGEDNSDKIVSLPSLTYAEYGSDSPMQIGTASNWVTVSVSPPYDIDNHYIGAGACAMNSVGELFCWGANLVGQQARGFWPRDIGGTWKSVATGRGISCGIRANDQADCWGTPFGGESLGMNEGRFGSVALPTAIDHTNVLTWSALSAGDNAVCGIALAGTNAPAGSAWCWGNERSGTLGNYPRNTCGDPSTNPHYGELGWYCDGAGISGYWQTKRTPQRVGDVACDAAPGCTYNLTWSQIDVGSFTACGITVGSELYCWGEGADGELGDGVTGLESYPHWYPDYPNNMALAAHRSIELFRVGSAGSGTPASDWIDISLGHTTISSRKATCGIREVSDGAGTLWCWGGVDGVGGGNATPNQVGDASDWIKVAVGEQHACAIKSDNSLWCWGTDGSGALGLGLGVGSAAFPTRLGTAVDWTDISAGSGMTCGIRADNAGEFANTLYCWGDNYTTILGRPTNALDSGDPIAQGADFNPDSVDMTYSHACVFGAAAIGCHGMAGSYALGAPFVREGTHSMLRLPTVDSGGGSGGGSDDALPSTSRQPSNLARLLLDLAILSASLGFAIRRKRISYSVGPRKARRLSL